MFDKFVNLTQHEIVLGIPQPDSDTGQECIFEKIPPSGLVARVSAKPGIAIGHCVGVEVYSATTFGEVENLPAPQKGVMFIVSGLVAGRCAGREDVASPGTGPLDNARRDSKGQIIWVTRLIRSC